MGRWGLLLNKTNNSGRGWDVILFCIFCYHIRNNKKITEQMSPLSLVNAFSFRKLGSVKSNDEYSTRAKVRATPYAVHVKLSLKRYCDEKIKG